MSVRLDITIDSDLCEANAYCVRAAPEVFRVDDADHLHLIKATVEGDELVDKVRAAARRCPRQAIALSESNQ